MADWLQFLCALGMLALVVWFIYRLDAGYVKEFGLDNWPDSACECGAPRHRHYQMSGVCQVTGCNHFKKRVLLGSGPQAHRGES